MSERSISLHDILSHLQDRNLLNQEENENILAYFATNPSRTSIPWYMQLLTAFGAWMSALFFIAFLFISEFINFESLPGMLSWGIIFLIIALTFFYKSKNSIFTWQLALALSAAGHILVLTGIGTNQNDFAVVVAIAIVLCFILYPLCQVPLHRFLSVLLTLILITTWIIHDLKNASALHLLIALQALALAWLYYLHSQNRPQGSLIYSLALALPLSLTIALFPEEYATPIQLSWWPSQVLLTLWVVYLIWRVYQLSGLKKWMPFCYALIGAVLMGVASSPGILAALGLLIIGHSLTDRWLRMLGLLSFSSFIFFFYYNMNIPLDTKSYILMASGALLLIGRIVLNRQAASMGGES